MPLTKSQKEEVVKELTDKFSRQKATVFVDFKGLDNKAIVNARKKARENSLEYKVAKKTMLNLATKGAGLPELPALEGQIGVVFGYDDEVAPSRVSYALQKEFEKLRILGGILENRFISQEEVLSLAKLPTKQELLGRVVGTINAPIQNFVYVLHGNIGNFVRVLHAISQRSG